MLPKLRCFDPEPEDQSTLIDWRYAAVVLSTLFLNFHFWVAHDLDFPMLHPVYLHASMLGAAALLIAALFFLGPALATYRARRPLVSIIEDSFGSIPAFCLRLCGALFLVIWIAESSVNLGVLILPSVLRHNPSATESGIVAVAIPLFLLMTGIQSLETSAKLAVFTNKLAIAILIAALLCVREGWSYIPSGFPISSERPAFWDAWHGFSMVAFEVAPLALLAADLGYRIRGWRQVEMTALAGIALPIIGSLLVVGAIGIATWHSAFYVPSLNPNITMALWSKAAAKALPGRMMIGVITTFGAGRFGARSLAESISIRGIGRSAKWAILGCCIGVMASIANHRDLPQLSMIFEALAGCLTVVGAVVSAGLITERRRTAPARRIDWVGMAALMAGWATPFYMPVLISREASESWWHPWLLPSFGVGFFVRLVSGIVQKKIIKEA